jgi:hypothetical protein
MRKAELGTARAGLLAAALFLVEPLPATAEETEQAPEPPSIAGTYDMTGHIKERSSGKRRPIAGRVIFDQVGSDYTATYHLRTKIRTQEGLRDAQVVGHGSGQLTGSKLEGKIETQLLLATVAGAPVGMPWAPRRYGPVIEQNTHAILNPDGSLTVEIDYEPVEGGPPEATRTTLHGIRATDWAH